MAAPSAARNATPSQPCSSSVPAAAFELHIPQSNPTLQEKAAMTRLRHDAPSYNTSATQATPHSLEQAQHALRSAFPLPSTPNTYTTPWWTQECSVKLTDCDAEGVWTPRIGPVPLCMDRDKISAVGKRALKMVATPEAKAAVDEHGVRAVTHYVYAGMRGGAWVVPPGDEQHLRRAIVTDFHNGVYTGITENKTRLWAAYVDLDFNTALTYAAVALVARVCHAVVCSVYAGAAGTAPHKMRAMVCVGAARDKHGSVNKTGVHIVWPDIVVGVQRQLVLAQKMRDMLGHILVAPPTQAGSVAVAESALQNGASSPPPPPPTAFLEAASARTAAWCDIVDGEVYQPGRGLRLPYCPKFTKCPRKAACPHTQQRSGGGVYVRCNACYNGNAPDEHSTVYVPMFVLVGIQKFKGAGAHLVPTAHTLTTSRDAASTTLLALCTVRRQGAVAPTGGFDPALENFAVVPDTLWQEARCTPTGHWLGASTKKPGSLRWSKYYSTASTRAMWQLQWRGESVPPHNNEMALLTALVQASSSMYAHIRVHSAQRFRDNDQGLVKWYAVHVVHNQADEHASGAHACANVHTPHRSATVYFIVHTHITPPGRTACMLPSVIQACTCRKKRTATVSGMRCADFQKRLMRVPDVVDRVLFPVVPQRDAVLDSSDTPPAAALDGVLSTLNEDFLDATASETRALSGVTRAREEELRRVQALVRAAPHNANAAQQASAVAHRAAVKRPATSSFATQLRKDGRAIVAKFKQARSGSSAGSVGSTSTK